MGKIELIITRVLLPIVAVVILYSLYRCKSADVPKVEKIEYVDSVGTYHELYYEDDFESLKKENKALYDSLKKYKDEITYLIKFKVKNEYSTGVVHTGEEENDSVESQTFEYTNEPNDTMRYNLKINAEKQPNWYSIDITTNSEYTIVNKTYENGQNHATIEGDGEISDVTIFKKKEKRKFWDRFSIGPGVTAGYDPINNRMGLTVGVTASFDLK